MENETKMENETRVVYVMHIVNENEGAKFPDTFIDLSEQIGFSNMSMEDLWDSVKNCYIDNKDFNDQYEKKKYHDKITIDLWIAERVEGYVTNYSLRNCKLLDKIVSTNVDEFSFLIKTIFN